MGLRKKRPSVGSQNKKLLEDFSPVCHKVDESIVYEMYVSIRREGRL